MINHLYILATILLTVAGQLLGKWRMAKYATQIPEGFTAKILFFFTHLLLDPYIILTYASAIIASFFWLMVVNKFELSYAYPFMGLAFVLVSIFSSIIFGEDLSLYKIIGTTMIIAGIAILSQSYKAIS